MSRPACPSSSGPGLRAEAGYTIMEVIVVVAIMVALLVGSTIGFSYWTTTAARKDCGQRLRDVKQSLDSLAADQNLFPGDNWATAMGSQTNYTNAVKRYFVKFEGDPLTCPASKKVYGMPAAVGGLPTCAGSGHTAALTR